MTEKQVTDIERIKSILRKRKAEIRKKFKADIRGVFGSYSRGSASGGSDVDILVRFEKGASLFGWAGLVQYLEEELGLKVDVVPETSLKEELRSQVLTDLIEV